MSTLPQIFRKSCSLSFKNPQKQGGIFSINLGYNKNNKIIQKERTSSALSKHSPPTTASRIYSSQRRGSHRQIINQFSFEQKNKIEFLEADSLRCLLENQQQKKQQILQVLKDIEKDQNQIKQDLNNLRIRKQDQLSQIKNKCQQYFTDIRRILSQCRRETGMQTKRNAKCCQILSQQLTQISQIFDEFHEKVTELQSKVLGKY